eukprot:1791905-Lingulodinium_polyedra.AAC.1
MAVQAYAAPRAAPSWQLFSCRRGWGGSPEELLQLFQRRAALGRLRWAAPGKRPWAAAPRCS